MPSHSEIQEYLKGLLEYYDFTVKKEYWISPSERIDLYGYSQSHGKSIGIEITFTSDVRKDAERLARAGFDLIFIVVDNPLYEGKIEYHGRIVPIVHYSSFESELRRILNISPQFPKFGSFEDWMNRRVMITAVEGKNKLNEFVQLLKSSGLDEFVESCKNTLALLYIAKEIPTCRLEPRDLSILKNFDLVFEDAKGSGELRTRFAYLTKKGKEVGREVILERITEHSEELKDLINSFGKMAAVIAIGTTDRWGGDLLMRLKVGEVVEDKGLTELLQLYSDRKCRVGEVYDLIVAMDRIIDFKDIVSRSVDSGEVGYAHPLIASFCYFLTYYRYSESKNFFRRLEDFGLAVEIPVYGSYGQYFGDEIRVPIEVGEFVLSNVRIAFDDELLREFGTLITIYKISQIVDPRTARNLFEDYLRFYEITLDYVKRVLDEFNKLGLTSRYIEIADSAPFVVLNKEGFEKAVKSRLYELAEKFLRV